MALPTTTASSISLSQIQTEFGGSNPIALSEYKRGGTYVPSGTATGTYGTAIPTTNSNLSMKNYYGTQAIFTTTMTTGFFFIPPFNNYGYYSGTAGSLSPVNISTMTGSPAIVRLNVFGITGTTFWIQGDQTSANPQVSTLEWNNTTQSTSGTITATVGSYSGTSSNYTGYTLSGDIVWSGAANDNVLWTINVS